jgi:hypothetical protein
MTAASQSPTVTRAAMWAAHREPIFLAVFLAAEAAAITVRLGDTSLAVKQLSYAWILPAAVAWMLALGAAVQHSHVQCAQCARTDRHDPALADRPAAAARHRRALRVWHLLTVRPWVTIVAPPLVVLCAVAVFSAVPAWQTWQWVLAAPVVATWILMSATGWRHRPLELWCSGCFNDDDEWNRPRI